MLTYSPNTVNGTGLLVPLLKIMVRPLYILGAIHNEWPMTLEQARAEMRDALARYAEIDWHHSGVALSAEIRDDIESWSTHLTRLQTAIDEAIRENDLDTTVIDTLAPQITEFSRVSWVLMSNLDKELVGMTDAQTDPGQIP